MNLLDMHQTLSGLSNNMEIGVETTSTKLDRSNGSLNKHENVDNMSQWATTDIVSLKRSLGIGLIKKSSL